MSALLALLLILHGGIHVGFVCSAGAWPFTSMGSWLAGPLGAGSSEALACLGGGLALTAFLGFLVAALAGVGILPARTWRPLVLVATVASLALLVLFVTPWTLAGIAIDVALLHAVVARGRRPTPVVGRGRARRPLPQ